MDTNIGRPRIGPKVQSNVPAEAKEWIKQRARRYKVNEALVVRELIQLAIDAVDARETAA